MALTRNGKNRLQLDVSDRQLETLKMVQTTIDTSSYAEVFRRALVIMEKIIEREKSGIQFGFCNDKNEFQQVWFI